MLDHQGPAPPSGGWAALQQSDAGLSSVICMWSSPLVRRAVTQNRTPGGCPAMCIWGKSTTVSDRQDRGSKLGSQGAGRKEERYLGVLTPPQGQEHKQTSRVFSRATPTTLSHNREPMQPGCQVTRRIPAIKRTLAGAFPTSGPQKQSLLLLLPHSTRSPSISGAGPVCRAQGCPNTCSHRCPTETPREHKDFQNTKLCTQWILPSLHGHQAGAL